MRLIPLLRADLDRARALAIKLYTAFFVSGEGIFGRKEMPEDEPPEGVAQGSLEHLLFITLTATIDYQRDAHELWQIARKTYANSKTRYLFDPTAIHEAGWLRVAQDMQRTQLSRKPKNDPCYWHTVAVSFLKKWDGDPRKFLADCRYHAPTILRKLRSEKHLVRGRWVSDYPYLRGPKISCLWIRMLRDNVGVKMSGLENIPIPVDVHILRATLCTGVLRGSYSGPIDTVFGGVRAVWKEVTRKLQLPNNGRAMIALDVDEPLWHLSKFGCSKRGNGELGVCPADCPAAPGCVSGRIVISGSHCEVKT